MFPPVRGPSNPHTFEPDEVDPGAGEVGKDPRDDILGSDRVEISTESMQSFACDQEVTAIVENRLRQCVDVVGSVQGALIGRVARGSDERI